MYRQQVQAEAQQLLTEYLVSLSHTSNSGVPTSFGVESSSASGVDSVQLRQPTLMGQFLEQLPVAEAGPSGIQQQ